MESVLELCRAWWLVRHRSFKSYNARLGETFSGEFIGEEAVDQWIVSLREISWALKFTNRLMRGRFTCLMLAMAGKRMLSRRSIPNTLVLGVCLTGGESGDPFGAHAWLRVGRYVVLGVEERERHIPVVSYYTQPR